MFNANIKYIHRSNFRKITKYRDRLASAKKQYMNDLKKGFNQDSVQGIDFFQENPNVEHVEAFKFDEPEVDTRFELPIVDFSEESMMEWVELQDDELYGGLSEAQLGYCQNTRSLHIQGIINVERADKMMVLPNFKLFLTFSRYLKLKGANGFRVELSSSNGNLISFFAEGLASNEIYYATNFGYISISEQDQSNGEKFISLDIPFNNMVQEELNLRKDRFFNHEETPMTPQRIGFYCESPVEAIYDFKIRKISAIYDPDLLRINEVQRREPFFIKSLKNYSDIKIDNLSDNYNLKFKQQLIKF